MPRQRQPKIEQAVTDLIAVHGQPAVVAALHAQRGPRPPPRPRGRPRKDAPKATTTDTTEPGTSVARLARLYGLAAVEVAFFRILDRRGQPSRAGAPKQWGSNAVYAWARVEAYRRVHAANISQACRALVRDGPIVIVRNLAGGPDLVASDWETLRRLHRQGAAVVAQAPAQQRPRLERIVTWHIAQLKPA